MVQQCHAKGRSRPETLLVHANRPIKSILTRLDTIFDDQRDSDNESILTRKEPKQEAAPVVAKKPAKIKKATKKTDGPPAAALAKIEALNAKVSRIPASDLFED